MKKYLIATLVMLLFASWTYADSEVSRNRGVSIHMLPRRVAQQDNTGSMKWGFGISAVGGQAVPRNKYVFQAADKLIEFYRTLPKDAQQNGVWIVTTHPNAYSEPEKKLLQEVKELCIKENIVLFTCRGSQLPNGWQRITVANLKE